MENKLPENEIDAEDLNEDLQGDETEHEEVEKAPKVILPIPKASHNILEPIGNIASFVVPLLLYIFTIAPNVFPGDAAEILVASNRFSLAHPPGYPLYMMLLKIWTSLPLNFGPDALAVKGNLFSALAMAFTCLFFFKTSRLLTGSAAASLGAALVLAFSRTVWKFSVITEVYTLNLLLIVLVLYGLALAREKKNPMGLVLSAFAFGLGLAHHHSIIAIAPLIFFLWPKGKSGLKIPVAGVIAGLILPLVFYLFLPVFAKNTPAYSDGFTAGNFVDYVSRADYRNRADFQDPATTPLVKSSDILARTGKYLGKQFGGKPLGWIVLILCVAGFFFAPSGRRVWAIWLLATALIWILAVAFLSRGSPLGMPYNYLRSVDEFLIPVNMFVAFGFAWLLAPLGEKLVSQADVFDTEGQNFISAKNIPVVILALFCVIGFFLAISNNRYSNMTHHTFYQDQSRNILEQVPDGGVLMVSGDEVYIYQYLQEVRGLRTDVELMEYPFVYAFGDDIQTPASSLALYIRNDLAGREIVFTFNEAADALIYLPDKALEMDGVAMRLVERPESGNTFFPGQPGDYWLNYQLRNVDKTRFFKFPPDYVAYDEAIFYLYPDDYEYEVFDRYYNGVQAMLAWLDNNGYNNDYSNIWFDDYATFLAKVRDEIDYPKPPE